MEIIYGLILMDNEERKRKEAEMKAKTQSRATVSHF
jgi:hypothetical protein